MIERLRQWLRTFLGLNAADAVAAHRHEAVTLMLDQIQDTLNAIQKDKLKFYVDRPERKPKAAPMDFEASQRATLEEFKEKD